MPGNFPPNFNPELYSFSAFIIGAILVDDLNVNEQNSIGNWLMLVAQYMLTNSAQQQLIESRIERVNININSKQAKKGGSPYGSVHGKSNQNTRDEVEFLIQEIQKMERELQKIKNSKT